MTQNDPHLGFSTKCVHTGNEIDKETGAIRRPITMANSYALPYDASTIHWGDPNNIVYTRTSGANQVYLQEKLAALEEGEDCVVLGSGVAAMSGMFFALLKSGDHVVCSDVSYIAVYRLLKEYLPEKYNINATLVDTSDLDAVRRAIRPETKLIHVETPGNPTIRISDIQAIAELAKKSGVLFSVDSTFASPFHQLPLKLGADLCVHSLTKYINGHGDAMGGAVIGKRDLIDKIKTEAMVNLGGAISPFNAWLIMRGAATLPLRMRQHSENALKVAAYLETVPHVRFVSYPGLKSHPQHATAKKQMANGFSGMLAFGLDADADTHNRFVSHLKIITSAVSLGHDESLIVFLGPDDERQSLYPPEFHRGFFRFSVGIEDAQDIITDIRAALEKTFMRSY